MLYSGAAVAFTAMPAAVTECPLGTAAINRRFVVKTTNRQRARLIEGGGTDGYALAELALQFTTDLTGATGWDYADKQAEGGPYCSCFDHGNINPNIGTWANIHPDFRDQTLLARIVGRNGDGVISPTLIPIKVQLAGRARYEAGSLEAVTAGDPLHPRDYVVVAASVYGGGGDPGDFGDLPVPQRAIPSGMTVIRGDAGGAGAPLAVFSTNAHGIEAGFAKAFLAAGLASGTRMVCQYLNGSDLAYQTATGLGLANVDVIAAGMTPRAVFYCGDNGIPANVSGLGGAMRELRAFYAKVQSLWPGAAVIIQGNPATDPVWAPFIPEARLLLAEFANDTDVGRTAYIDPTGVALQPDGGHPTSVGTVDEGERAAAVVIAGGIY